MTDMPIPTICPECFKVFKDEEKNKLLDTLKLFLKIYKLENGITEGTIPFVNIVELAENTIREIEG